MVVGRVFNIQRFCLHDGPGIRTTVFLKGCPLRCHWCHNPESQDPRPQIVFFPDRCVTCGACTPVCPAGAPVMAPADDPNPQRCIRCGACVEVCPADARQTIGQTMTVEQVLREVLRDQIFYDDSAGGVTISGGEPLAQGTFLLELLRRCKQAGLHTAVDTCGYGAQTLLLDVAELTDLFLYDIKLLDDGRHEWCTGVSNSPILRNLRALAAVHHCIWLRVPLIPGINDDPAHLAEIARLAASLPAIRQVNLLPYHQTAAAKRQRLGTAPVADIPPLDPRTLTAAARPFLEHGLATFTGG
jgi:pyruvate formate lyase activating enzyme